MKRLSPRELRRMQARMLGSLGLDLKELGTAEEVVIRFHDREIVVRSPSVVALQVEKERVFQIVGGEAEERAPTAPSVEQVEEYTPSDDDVMLVMAQSGASEEEARKALQETRGDLARAILLLKTKK